VENGDRCQSLTCLSLLMDEKWILEQGRIYQQDHSTESRFRYHLGYPYQEEEEEEEDVRS
jgi:hypothetical protein